MPKMNFNMFYAILGAIILLHLGHTFPAPMPMQFIDNNAEGHLLSFKTYFQNIISYLSHKYDPENVGAADCAACEVVIGALKVIVDSNVTMDKAIMDVAGTCTGLGIETEEICYYAVANFLPEIRNAYTRVEDILSISEVCAFILGGSCVTLDEYLQVFDWNITLNYPEPPYIPPPQPSPTSPTLRIMHVTDTHFDDKYLEGSVSNCIEPLCCRANAMAPPDKAPAYAGKYGGLDGDCDIPQITFESMLDYAANLNVDLIYYTGDIPTHDVWNQTKDGNNQRIKLTTDLIKSRFPTVNIAFFSAGNHESEPCDGYPVPMAYDDYNMSYLYTQFNSIWTSFTPDVDSTTILKGGYYSYDVRPNLRVISLNTNYAHDRNWWLIVQSQDPTEQLQWLIDQLDDAEQNNIKVHIIGHIPPGKFTYVWSRNFRDVVDRYKSTIAGQFYGHTHHDEFEVIYDDEDTTFPISVAHIAPSVTTGSRLNPAFRIYTVDGDYTDTTWQVLDYEEHWLDINQANADGFPTWKLLYTAKEEYVMSDLTPASFDNLIDRMETDDALFQTFYQNFYRVFPKPPCEFECKDSMLCSLRKGWAGYNTELCPSSYQLETI
ncbi:hypothetical protein CHUAL_003358 [Chamberlinius hualienensis]